MPCAVGAASDSLATQWACWDAQEPRGAATHNVHTCHRYKTRSQYGTVHHAAETGDMKKLALLLKEGGPGRWGGAAGGAPGTGLAKDDGRVVLVRVHTLTAHIYTHVYIYTCSTWKRTATPSPRTAGVQ